VAAYLEVKTGDSWSYRFTKFMQRNVRVDRENDQYERPSPIRTPVRSFTVTPGR
jgi:hypothetical protein